MLLDQRITWNEWQRFEAGFLTPKHMPISEIRQEMLLFSMGEFLDFSGAVGC